MGVGADNPIRDATEDELGRAQVAEVIANEIRHLDASQGFVVGVLGTWGSGKTSLVNLVRCELAQSPTLEVLDFNPWMFSGADELLQSFFFELGAQFRTRGERLRNLADDLEAYGELVAPLRLLPLVGIWFERSRSLAASVRKALKRREGGVLAQRNELAERLAELTAPVVIVIDDIDRLRTGEIRDIFKLVRLTGHFPNIVYLLAFDRHRVEQALTEDGLVGRDYLEKILQITYDIPTVPESLLTRRLAEEIDTSLADIDDAGPFESGLWPDILVEIIRPLIRNMRDVRRYVASLHGTVVGLEGRISLVDVLGLEAIRVFLPDTFVALSSAQEALTTVSSLSGRSEPPHLKATIERLLASTPGYEVVVRAMIMRLFPAALHHIENMHYGQDYLKIWRRDRRVAHAEVLAFYLERAAGESLQAFRVAERAFSAMDDQVALNEILNSVAGDQLADVVAGLEVYEDDYPSAAIVPACIVLLNQTHRVPERSGGFFGVRGDITIARVVLRLIRRLDGEAEVEAAVRMILPQVHQLSDRWDLIRLVGHIEGAGHRLVSQEVAADLERGLRDQVRAADSAQLSTERDLMRLVHWTRTEATTLGEPPFLVPESTDVDDRLLRSSVTEVRAASMGSRAVASSKRLFWDVLVEIVGGEDGVRRMIARLTPRADSDVELAEILKLAQRYLDGWRPDEHD